MDPSLETAFNAEQPRSSHKSVIDPSDPLETKFLVNLPVDIKIERIHAVTEVKQFWRQGLRQIEQMFQDHVSKMNDMFEDTVSEYEQVRTDLLTNHEFLKKFYLDMQRKLNEKMEAI
jgi:hypothetical protein